MRKAAIALLVAAASSAEAQASQNSQTVFLDRTFWGESRILVLVCNEYNTQMRVRPIGGGYFKDKFAPLVPPHNCETGIFLTYEPVTAFTLSTVNQTSVLTATVPPETSWSDTPWSYLIFLFVGFLTSVFTGPLKSVLSYPFKLGEILLVLRETRRGFYTHIDDLAKPYEIDTRLAQIAIGELGGVIWLPKTLRTKIAQLYEAHALWKSKRVLSDEDKSTIRRLAGIAD